MLALLVACAPDTLGPSRPVEADAMVRALPADAAVVLGVDLAAVRATPAWEAAVERWIDAEAFDGAMAAWTGGDGPRRVRAACGADGCVALAEGDFAALSPALLAEAGADLGVRPRRHGADVRAGGHDLVARRLGPTKGVVGDRAAVRRLAAAHADGAPGFDAAALAGIVPAGDVWVALADPTVADGIDDVEVAAVALALDPDAPTGTLRARARMVDAAAAHRRAAALSAAWAPLAARYALDADIVAVGATVEMTAPVDPDSLDRVLRGVR